MTEFSRIALAVLLGVATGCTLEHVDVTGLEVSFPELGDAAQTGDDGPGGDGGGDGAIGPAIPVYYSIGRSTGDLKSGTPTLTIVNGMGTFSLPQPGNVGVGDVVHYLAVAKAQRVFISSRVDDQNYTLITNRGETPGDTTAAPVSSIMRAFNTLRDADSLTQDSVDFLGTGDLVAGNFQLNWPCYNDAPLDETLDIGPWITGEQNYIRLYAPYAPNEVGLRQRHDGVAGTGFAIRPVTTTPDTPYAIAVIRSDFVRIEGIEIDGSGVSNGESVRGLVYDAGGSAASDVRIDGCIIRNIGTSAASGPSHAAGVYQASGGVLKVSNSIVYRIEANGPSSAWAAGIRIERHTQSTFIHSNTVLDVTNTASTNDAHGIDVGDQVTVSLVNNYVGGTSSTNGGARDFAVHAGAVLHATHNVSSDDSALFGGAATEGEVDQTEYTAYFVEADVDTDAVDLHLLDSSDVLWSLPGTNLNTDADLPVLVDVDGLPRPDAPDVGADEFGN